MSKGSETRRAIVERAASLFNERGYSASMQEITEATGLQRGGIYNHFESKEDLAAASFEYATETIRTGVFERIEKIASPIERLRAIPQSFFDRYAESTAFPNGCVVLNTAIEAKRHMPALRERSQRAMRGFLGLVERSVRAAVRAGELPAGTRAPEVAAIFISTLEGAMLLGLLYDDRSYLRGAVRHLHWYLDTIAAAGAAAAVVPATRRRKRA